MDTQFQNWFNKSKNEQDAINKGYWDVTYHILTPTVCQMLIDKDSALEIGYGGGRLLNPMSKYFRRVVGVDIHGESEKVTDLLHRFGTYNFELIQNSGSDIPVKDDSISFVYSFIVLQHLSSYKEFLNYISETKRVLKNGGIAQLYFGKYTNDDEEVLPENHVGYVEAKGGVVNTTTLRVHLGKVKEEVAKLGFKLLDNGVSKQLFNEQPAVERNQRYVTLLKL